MVKLPSKIIIIVVAVAVFAIGIFFILQNKKERASNSFVTEKSALPKFPFLFPLFPPKKLNNPPEIVKAVYVTRWSAGSSKYLEYLDRLFKNAEINAVVVDIKDSTGNITDIGQLVKFFHDRQIYVIGRIAVFEDPIFSKARSDLAIYDKTKPPITLWQDNNGLSWLDPASKDVWNYNIFLAKQAFYRGFDEINFDYVRFPSDGKTENMGFPIWNGQTAKSQVIKEFFNYVRLQLPNEKISVDLFGQTTISADDMGIGQKIEDTFDSFDFISPMLYPSHYANGFIGYDNPAEHPYEIIKYSLENAKNRIPLAKFRPWLQDFNMGAEYNAVMVAQEIKAVKDALGENYKGYMLWNPSNVYSF